MSTPKDKRRYIIDSSPYVAVVVCKYGDGCKWRASAHTKPSAYRLVADHLARAHHDKRAAGTARESAAVYARRLAATGDRVESVTP